MVKNTLLFFALIFFISCQSPSDHVRTNEAAPPVMEQRFQRNFSRISAPDQGHLQTKGSSLTKEHCVLGTDAVTHEALTIYPIYATDKLKQSKNSYGQYIGLEEGLKQNKIVVEEKGDERGNGASVNTLYIQNTSQDTCYVLAGQVVEGGKQDRTFANDIVLLPNSKKYDVSVFCVEQGRWEVKDEVGVALMDKKKFKKAKPMAKASLRKAAIVSKDQGKVWEKVSEAHANNATRSSTSNYNQIRDSEEFVVNEDKYQAAIKKGFANKSNVVGVIAVSNGKVVGCDVFPTKRMFEQMFHLILPSYVGEVIIGGKEKTTDSKSAAEYFDKVFSNAQKQKTYLDKNGRLYSLDKRPMHLISY